MPGLSNFFRILSFNSSTHRNERRRDSFSDSDYGSDISEESDHDSYQDHDARARRDHPAVAATSIPEGELALTETSSTIITSPRLAGRI